MGVVIEFGAGDAFAAQQALFHQPHAGGAGDAAEHKRGLFLVFGQRFHKFRLYFGQVV